MHILFSRVEIWISDDSIHSRNIEIWISGNMEIWISGTSGVQCCNHARTMHMLEMTLYTRSIFGKWNGRKVHGPVSYTLSNLAISLLTFARH